MALTSSLSSNEEEENEFFVRTALVLSLLLSPSASKRLRRGCAGRFLSHTVSIAEKGVIVIAINIFLHAINFIIFLFFR